MYSMRICNRSKFVSSIASTDIQGQHRFHSYDQQCMITSANAPVHQHMNSGIIAHIRVDSMSNPFTAEQFIPVSSRDFRERRNNRV
jgi:hypothetical protein